MAAYRYRECGLDNVIIEGVQFPVDDGGEEVVTIPRINVLHRLIARLVATKPSGLTGRELRFLRTEMGLTQAELARIVHREPLAISRWERGEVEIDQNAEALIRLHAIEELDLDVDVTVREVSEWTVASAKAAPFVIDGSNAPHYRPKSAA